MRYDGAARRVELVTRPNGGATTTMTFRYQGGAIAQELTNGTLTRTLVTDEAGTIVKVCDPDCTGTNAQYLVTWNGHGDALGLWLINSDGTLTLKNSYSYSTWGQPTTTTHNGAADLGFRYLYVGRFGVAWDNAFGLGLHFMSARHYSPALGRFLQPDPSALEVNLYAYTGNSPVSKVDPSGECAVAAAGFGPFGIAFAIMTCVPTIVAAAKTVLAVGAAVVAVAASLSVIAQNRARGEEAERILRDRYRRQGFYVRRHVYFPTPAGARYLDICAWRSSSHYYSAPRRPLFCVEVKTGGPPLLLHGSVL